MKINKPRIKPFIIDPPPRPFSNLRPTRVKHLMIDIYDINEAAERDLESGYGFLVTDEKDFDKRDIKTKDGLHSQRWGNDAFSDEPNEFMYRCNCNKTVGGVREGDICQYCGFPVTYQKTDLEIPGYIYLGKHAVLNPTAYENVKKLMGEKSLEGMLKFNRKYDMHGHAEDIDIEKLATQKVKYPFQGIGMILFQRHFDFICDYYLEKKLKGNASSEIAQGAWNNIQKYRSAIFTNYVRVYTSILRPLLKSGSKISVFKVNTHYLTILKNANNLKSPFLPTIDLVESALSEIHVAHMEVFSEIITQLSGKDGRYRAALTSARLEPSGRAVIAPIFNSGRVDMVDLPYLIGIELLRPYLIAELYRITDMTMRECDNRITAALRHPDKMIWTLANYIIQNTKSSMRVMIQRNPTLLQESIRACKIRCIKADIYDVTLNIHTGILKGANADYDGDSMAIVLLTDERIVSVFNFTQNPNHHFISRQDGEYSRKALFIKDTAVVLSELWEMGKTRCYWENYATKESLFKAI